MKEKIKHLEQALLIIITSYRFETMIEVVEKELKINIRKVQYQTIFKMKI